MLSAITPRFMQNLYRVGARPRFLRLGGGGHGLCRTYIGLELLSLLYKFSTFVGLCRTYIGLEPFKVVRGRMSLSVYAEPI